MTQRPLRIMQVLRAPVGGLFRHVGDLTEALAARGHAIAIVADSTGGDARTEEKLAAMAGFASLGIHRLPIPRVLGLADLTTPLRLRTMTRKLGIDVIHGHGAKGGFAARLVRLAAKPPSAPVALYTPHGGVLHYPQGSMTGRLFRTIERALLAQTDAVIFESAFAQAAFTAAIASPCCPARVIHNGLSAAEFVPVTPLPGAADFVFIGEFRTLKGIDFLLDALVGVRRGDGRPATLVMAGAGSDFERIKTRIATLGLGDRVELAGVQPARDMLARGRCVVVPSLAESLPYVILEAAAAARPVIATKVGGIAEIFGPTAPDLLPPGDTPALREAMQAYLDAPEPANAATAARLAFIRPRFSIDHMAGEIEALYYEALAAKAGKPPV